MSTAPGGTWEPFARIPQGQLIAEAASDVAGTRRIYVLTTQGLLLRTNDDGATWQTIPLPNPPATKIAINPFRPGHVILHTGNQAFLSIDGGATLQPISIPPASIPTSPISLELDPAATDTVCSDGRRYISQDSGITWKANSPGRFGRRVFSTLEPEKCYAIEQRFDNVYIEKFDSQNILEWASYWGDHDLSPPRTAFVDKDGLLWLNTGRRIARVAPEVRLVDIRPAVAVFKPGESTVTLLEGGLNFLPKVYAWAKDGSLLVAGNNYFSSSPRRSRVELHA